MKIWESEHTFNHPWETVTQAAWRKYPNPMNPAVVGIDVVDRHVTENGVLCTQRLICTKWGLPGWVKNFTGSDKTCFVSEYSEVDATQKTMVMQSRNLSLCKYLSFDEKLTYSAHPTDVGSTVLMQEAVVTVKGIPLSSYLEDVMTSTISVNANKGRQAMEWVISKINAEVQELTTSAAKSMDELTMSAKRSMDDVTRAARKGMDDLQNTLSSKLPSYGD
jgi:hypothetical protein